MQNSFTATQIQRNPSDVFNAVQSCGIVSIKNKARPEMVLMLQSSYDILMQTVKDLSDEIEKIKDGIDYNVETGKQAEEQLDLLK